MVAGGDAPGPQGLRQARRMELGLEPARVLIASLQVGMNGYTPETGLGFYRELRQRWGAPQRPVTADDVDAWGGIELH